MQILEGENNPASADCDKLWKLRAAPQPDLTTDTQEDVSTAPESDVPSQPELRGGYDPAFFETLARVEDRHFWFRGRNQLIFQFAHRIASQLKPGYRVLEVGCGTGNVLRVLREACPTGTVVGLELWFDGLRHAQKRSQGPLVQGDVRDYPFAKPFDLIGMFDVLEHVREDRETLSSLRENLTPGGCLLLTVPAHQFLWSYFDEAACHCRRYSVREIRKKLTEAGFEVEFVSQFMACIFPIAWIVRRMRRSSHQDDVNLARARATEEFRLVPIVNQMLAWILGIEAKWVARRHRLPWGTSLVVVGRKPA